METITRCSINEIDGKRERDGPSPPYKDEEKFIALIGSLYSESEILERLPNTFVSYSHQSVILPKESMGRIMDSVKYSMSTYNMWSMLEIVKRFQQSQLPGMKGFMLTIEDYKKEDGVLRRFINAFRFERALEEVHVSVEQLAFNENN